MNFSNFFIDMMNGSNTASSMDSKKSPSPAFLFSDIMKVCEDENVNSSSAITANTVAATDSSKEIFSAADSVISVTPQELDALGKLVASIIKESGNVQPTSTNYNIDQTKISKQQFILSENKLVDLLSDLITQSNYPLGPFINQLQSSQSNQPITISFKSGSDKLTISFNPIKVDENYTNSIISDEYGFVNKLIVKEGLFDKSKVKALSFEEDVDTKAVSDDEAKTNENFNSVLPNQIFFRTEILKIINTSPAVDGSTSGFQALNGESTISTFLAYKNFVASNKVSGQDNSTEVSATELNTIEFQKEIAAAVNNTVANKTDANPTVYTSTVSESTKVAVSSEQNKMNLASENEASTSSKEIIFTAGEGNGNNVSIASLMDGLSDEEKSVFKNMTTSGELKEIIYSKESRSNTNISNADIKNSPTLDRNEPVANQVNNSTAVNKQAAENIEIVAAVDSEQVVSSVSTEESYNDPMKNVQVKQIINAKAADASSINGNKVFTLSTDKPTVSLSADPAATAEAKNVSDITSIENSKVVVKINAKVSGKIDVKVESGNASGSNEAKEFFGNTKTETVIKNEAATATQNVDATENIINGTTVAQKEMAISSTTDTLVDQSKLESDSKNQSADTQKINVEQKDLASVVTEKKLFVSADTKATQVNLRDSSSNETKNGIIAENTISKESNSTDTKNAFNAKTGIKEESAPTKNVELPQEKINSEQKETTSPALEIKSKTADQKNITAEVKVTEIKNVTVAENIISKESKSTDTRNELNAKTSVNEESASTKKVELPQEKINSAHNELSLSDLEIKAKAAEQKNITTEVKVLDHNELKAEAKNITLDDNIVNEEIKSSDTNRNHIKMPSAKEENVTNVKNESASDKEINLIQKENTVQEKNTISTKTDLNTGKVETAVQQENASKVLAKEEKTTTTKDSVEAKETTSQDSKEVKQVDKESKPNLNSDDNAKHNANESFKNTLAQTVSKDGEIGKTKVPTEPVRIIRQNEIIPEFTKFIQQNEKQTMTFQVTPENLGKVKLIVDLVNNQIQTRIEVENEQVKQFIQSNVDQLKQNLQSSGIQLSDVNISLTDYSQKNSGKVFTPKKKSLFNQDKEIKSEEISDQPLKKMGYNTYEYLA